MELSREDRMDQIPVLEPFRNGAIPTRAWRARACLNWAKVVLLNELVPENPHNVLCEINTCGMDLGKYVRAHVGRLICMDARKEWLAEAKRKWQTRRDASLVRSDFVLIDTTSSAVDVDLYDTCDSVCCFDGFEECFRSKESLRQYLQNISALLKEGGFFFGISYDSSSLWQKCQMDLSGRRARGGKFRVEIPHRDGRIFSRAFSVRIDGEIDTLKEYGDLYVERSFFVDYPTLLAEAKQANLRMVEVENMTDFFAVYSGLYRLDLESFLNASVRGEGGSINLPHSEMDVLSLFTTFTFVKDRSVMEVLMGLQRARNELVASVQEMQKNLQKLVEQRQQLGQQQKENELVKEELDFIEGDGEGKVFKIVGPVLVGHSLEEARDTVGKRLEYLEKELKRTDGQIEKSTKEMEGKQEKLQETQMKMQQILSQQQSNRQ